MQKKYVSVLSAIAFLGSYYCLNTSAQNTNRLTPCNLQISATPHSMACVGDNGSATSTISGGNGGYHYTWNTNPVQTNANATGLTAGSYTVTVTDTNSCTATASVTITQPPYTISNFAGTGSTGYNGDNIPATTGSLKNPWQMAIDPSGNVYVADLGHNIVRKINTSGIITTVVGAYSTGGYAGDGGPASAAKLDAPSAVALDAAGDIYVTDESNFIVRKVSNGIITLFAGHPDSSNYLGDGGLATAAYLGTPSGIAVDHAGNVYISDAAAEAVRVVDLTGVINTYAGTGNTGYSGDNGQATAAKLHTPDGICLDANDNLYIADYSNNCIRRVDHSTHIITTFAGTTVAGYSGDGGPATSAEMRGGYGVGADALGNIYITDAGNARIREVTTDGIIHTIAGNGIAGYSGDGQIATKAKIDGCVGIVVDASFNVYFSDFIYAHIRELHACPYCSLATQITHNLICNTDNNGVVDTSAQNTLGSLNGAIFSWSNGPTTHTDVGLTAGTYTLTMIDSLGCTATSSVTLSGIIVKAAIVGPDSVCRGDEITLSASGGSSFLWSNNSINPNLEVAPLDDTTYSVKVSQGPCSDSILQHIYVATDGSICQLKFYTGLTPNGDGHNDYWVIDNIELYPGNYVAIYNRWGTKVWSANGYNNNTIVWKGFDSSNQPLPDGTYYYMVQVNNRTYKGWVQITR